MIAAILALVAIAVIAGADGPALEPQTAANFKIRTLGGQRLELAKLLRHGPVVLDFWATWCAPCVEALPEFEALQKKYGPRGLTIVGVSVDGPRNFSKVRPFTASKGLTYPIVLDTDGRLQELYHVVAIPTAFLIDTTGTIAKVRVAYRPGEGAAFEESVQALLPPASEP